MKNKKATIITFHCVPNYGAILQAYGLQEVLKKYFDKVELLDYQPKSLMKEYQLINWYSIPSVISTMHSSRKFMKKKEKFNQFREKYIHLSDMTGCVADNFKEYNTDYYFLGSDQIWNPEITHGLDPVYFGQVGGYKEIQSISYAASIGKCNYTKEELDIFSELLKGISSVSVREQEAAELLENALGVKADVVVDPTILAGKECFEKLIRPVSKKKYLFVYSLTGNMETQAIAEKISRYYKLPIIEISGKRKPLIKKKHCVIYDAGPEEFLSYIWNADYVVTDSFHGTVFSILFHKRFSTIPHKTRGGRMKTLLSMVDLTERLTNNYNRAIVEQDINWAEVDKKLLLIRNNSKKFIERAVHND